MKAKAERLARLPAKRSVGKKKGGEQSVEAASMVCPKSKASGSRPAKQPKKREEPETTPPVPNAKKCKTGQKPDADAVVPAKVAQPESEKKTSKPKARSRRSRKKVESGAVVEAKGAQEKKPVKSKKGRKQKTDLFAVEADPEVKAEIQATVKECVETGCCHPSFEMLDYDKAVYQFSAYWSRCAVGIKVSRDAMGENVKRKKGKKKVTKPKRRQVEYFSCPTDCTYTNYCLANRYVSCRDLTLYA